MPAGLIKQDDGMGPRFDGLRDLLQVEGHGFAIAARQHQARTLALFGADGTEDIGRVGALIVRRAWPGAAFGPSTGDLVFLPDAGLVGEPDLYALACRLAGRDLRQAGGEIFLKAATASGFCA